MKSVKCVECGFVSWSDAGNCKGCGALLVDRSATFPQPRPVQSTDYTSWDEPEEGIKKGLAIFALVLGIISFLTFGLLGIGAVTGIIVAMVAMGKVKREPWRYGGRGMAIAGLVLSITSLVTAIPVGMVAAIAIPNFLAARMVANERSAIHTLRMISNAEETYQSTYQRYGTFDELAERELIDPSLATGLKNGYQFKLELTTNEVSHPGGFEVTGVPVKYQSSGRRSFYVDESSVIRAADNYGRPSTKLDAPLETEYEYRTRTAARKSGREAGY
jgi:type II secretory pathway pseudopilin PulG